jgi:hypothetical protein
MQKNWDAPPMIGGIAPPSHAEFVGQKNTVEFSNIDAA